MTRNIVLFDLPGVHDQLLPLSYTRPVADFVLGTSTLREKWEEMMPGDYSYFTAPYLSEKYPMKEADDTLFIASNIVASPELAAALGTLPTDAALTARNTEGDEVLVAFRGTPGAFRGIIGREGVEMNVMHFDSRVTEVRRLTDIFRLNGRQIEDDFQRLCRGREGQPIHRSNIVIGSPELIFIESGAVVEGVVLNASHGPIYIGRDVEVMEGSCLRGPIALLEHATVNMGTKIYPGTTIGPWCKVGGELNNVVMFGYSNKAHDGFLGNAVIGQWCNLGAGCVASNLKNDYTEIKLWNYPAHRFLRTGLQFCGLIMADHSKAGINTMFNTATVVGVGVNIHGSGFPRNFVASFQEGGAAGFNDVPMEKFFSIAERMMARRGKALTDAEVRIFNDIRRQAENYK